MTAPCTCDLSRCVPCDEARDAELRRTFPNEGEVMEHDYRDVLRKAASLVEEGWFAVRRSGHFQTNPTETGECALTSTNTAAVALGVDISVEVEADQALIAYLGTNDIPGWNDAEGRTADEVADALRRAAK